MVLSARIMVKRRFQRSTKVPITGPKITWGNSPTREAVARTVAEPVVLVSHQINANWTSWLPNNENACPVQMVKKGGAQLFDDFISTCMDIAYTPYLCPVPYFPINSRNIKEIL
jgi:hypothetical protein